MKIDTCDLHTHILPGIDDGSPDFDISLAMLRLAADSGTTDLFATPHVISGSYLPAWDTVLDLTAALNRAARAENLPVTVHCGAEVALDWSLLDLLAAPGPYCLAGGRYILVELPLGVLPAYADEFLFTLQARDFLPVLAHPERNPDVKRDPACLQRWLDRGILAQVNASSLTGAFGTRTAAAAETLLDTGRVHFIGSDAHGMGVRRCDLRSAAQLLTERLGAAAARTLLETNPARLLGGEEDIPAAPARPSSLQRPKERGWIARFVWNEL